MAEEIQRTKQNRDTMVAGQMVYLKLLSIQRIWEDNFYKLQNLSGKLGHDSLILKHVGKNYTEPQTWCLTLSCNNGIKVDPAEHRLQKNLSSMFHQSVTHTGESLKKHIKVKLTFTQTEVSIWL